MYALRVFFLKHRLGSSLIIWNQLFQNTHLEGGKGLFIAAIMLWLLCYREIGLSTVFIIN